MKVLITGAAGGIGRTLRAGFAGRYALLRLADIARQAAPGAGEECLTFDIAELDATIAACRGMDCVVHLAGIPVEPEENPWEQVLPANIVGTHNVFEAARRAGVPRVVFASSNHVVGFHRRERTANIDATMRPDSYYGVSKVFGEAIGRLYADKHGMSVACLRIGSFRETPEDRRQLATWISPADTVQLFRRCIEAPEFHFVVMYGISDNDDAFWSNRGMESVGYVPQDKAAEHASALAGRPEEDHLERLFHGGSFCSMNFSGDANLID